MSNQIVIDAGPALNFFATNQQNILFGVLGPITAPNIVVNEVRSKSASDARLSHAATVLGRLPARLLTSLSDDVTPEVAAAVQRICGVPMPQRVKSPKGLGETMVVAHASVAAENGTDVFVLIDDGGGARMATTAAQTPRTPP